MENQITNTLNELGEWFDICSIKAELGLKVDIYDILAMVECLDRLELLRANEEEVEMS